MADHTLLPFQAPMPSRPVQRPQQQIRSDCELGYGGCFTSELILTAAQVRAPAQVQAPAPSPAPAQVRAAVYVPAAVQEDLDDDSEMWNMFLDEVKEEDSRFTDAWKEDASSIITFVSHNLLGPCVHLGDKLKDRSSLRNCWRIHH
jgi:hypothetical protein